MPANIVTGSFIEAEHSNSFSALLPAAGSNRRFIVGQSIEKVDLNVADWEFASIVYRGQTATEIAGAWAGIANARGIQLFEFTEAQIQSIEAGSGDIVINNSLGPLPAGAYVHIFCLTLENCEQGAITFAKVENLNTNGGNALPHELSVPAITNDLVVLFAHCTQADTATWTGATGFISENASTTHSTHIASAVATIDGNLTAGFSPTAGASFATSIIGLAIADPSEVNVAPVLDAAAPDFEIQEGQVWSYNFGANFSDANTGDTATYSISPNLAAVAGFAFDTATGTGSANGTQVAAAGVSYTVTRTDSGGLTASDTFIITVVPPKLLIGTISDTTPVINTQITVNHSNAQGLLTTPNFNIASQSATQAVIDIPDITTFILAGQTFPTINFNAAISIPLSDGVNSADVNLTGIQNPAGTYFGQITSIDPDGRYAVDPAITVGMFAYFYDIVGTWVIDPATGITMPDDAGGSLKYKIYNGFWSTEPATYSVSARPLGTVTIDSIVPSKTGAQIEVSYPGTDLTGYQYRLNGGAWVASTSSITLSSLTSSTTYTFEVAAVNSGRIGDISTTTFTTQAAVDTTPNAFSFTAQTSVARSVFVTSSTITVQGVDAGVDIPITVSGTSGEYSVSTDGGSTWGAWTTTATNVRLNYQVRARHLSSSLYNTPINTVVTIGGVSGTFTSTTLADTVAPVISLTGGNMSIVEGTTWVEPGYSAIDNADGDISVTGVVITGTVNTNVPGVYTLTYTATDAAGNSASTTRTVTVTAFVPGDTQAPSISLIGGNRTLNEGDIWLEPGYSATDNVDGNITGSVIVTGSVNTSVPGTYTLTYTATDAAGNTGSVTRTVTVLAPIQYPIDSLAPSSRTFVAERLNRIEKGEKVFIKQPDEILDYDFDVDEWLTAQGDTLAPDNYSLSVGDSDLEIVGSGKIPGVNRIKVWIAKGGAGDYAKPVELTIITAGFRKAQFIIRIIIVDRV